MFSKILKSPKNLTVFLAVILVLMAFQTYSLVSLSIRLNQAGISFTQAGAVNLSNGNTPQPEMVGGC